MKAEQRKVLVSKGFYDESGLTEIRWSNTGLSLKATRNLLDRLYFKCRYENHGEGYPSKGLIHYHYPELFQDHDSYKSLVEDAIMAGDVDVVAFLKELFSSFSEQENPSGSKEEAICRILNHLQYYARQARKPLAEVGLKALQQQLAENPL